MKKILFIAAILLAVTGTKSFAQLLAISNQSGCDITVELWAHDNSNPGCMTFNSISFVLPTGTTDSFSDVTALNGTGIYGVTWAGGYSATSLHSGWDVAKVSYGLPPLNCGNAVGATCSGYTTSVTLSCGCLPTISWMDLGSGNIFVFIHP